MLENSDAFGHALLDCYNGKGDHYIIEREDGYMEIGNLKKYFAEYDDWSRLEKKMVDLAHGRILDIGCGAGRHSLHLQKQLGFSVMAIDSSPLAIKVAQMRGVEDRLVASVDDLVEDAPGFLAADASVRFGTIIMMGHNIGLLHSWEEARKILKALHLITNPGARIVGTTRDPHKTDNAAHKEYVESNIRRGRMPGQIRFRIRHKEYAGEWLDYLFLSPEELEKLVDGTGWVFSRHILGCGGPLDATYMAILTRA